MAVNREKVFDNKNITYMRGELLYDNPLSCPDDTAGFVLEGEANVNFREGRLRLSCKRDFGAEGQVANIVYWCPKNFPTDVEINWEFFPASPYGLCILFYGAQGLNGEDLFDPMLNKRTGEYHLYYNGDIRCLHVSYYRRVVDTDMYLSNLRKSPGFHLVGAGGDPIPPYPLAMPPYRMRVVKLGDETEFLINGLSVLHFKDDYLTYSADRVVGGKIGFRQMSPMIGEYSSLKVYEVRKK